MKYKIEKVSDDLIIGILNDRDSMPVFHKRERVEDVMDSGEPVKCFFYRCENDAVKPYVWCQHHIDEYEKISSTP